MSHQIWAQIFVFLYSFCSEIQFYTYVYVNDVRNEPVLVALLGIFQPISHGGIFLLHTLAHMFSVDLSFI